AHAAQRQQRLHAVLLRVVPQLAAQTLRDVDDRVALVADDGLGRRQLDLERSAAVRALQRAAFQRLLAAAAATARPSFDQPGHCELGEADRTPDRPAWLTRAAVVQRADLAARASQVADEKAAREVRRVRQLALCGDQLGRRDRCSGPTL